ncbi:universal stress protein [Sporocytophaga myxococcoides]|uniref:universal stress protein n=1 Tax=Sporocytophaga myxococcoides TaxID=153721 RepID=UPI0003F88E35|nr:universal stress protein [Sporocytophaga myxococcoides]
MIRKIVCPTDYSDNSLNAIKYLKDLAALSNANIEIVHVQTPIPHPFSAETDDLLQNIKHEKLVLWGNVTDEIVNEITKTHADIVGISSLGKNKEENFFISKVTLSIVNQSSFPILIIPPDANFQSFNRFLFVSHLKDQNYLSFRWIAEFIRPYSGRFEVLYFSEERLKWYEKKEVVANFESLHHSLKTPPIDVHINDCRNVLIRLETFAREQRADVICIEKSSRIFQMIIEQDNIDKMPCCTDTPILIVPTI